MNYVFKKMKKDFDEFMTEAQKFVEETKANNHNTGDYNTGHHNSGDYNTGDYNTGDYNTKDYNTGYCNAGYRNSGCHNTGHWNTGSRNDGRCNVGDCNIGSWNTGNRNAGNFNAGDWNEGNCNTGNWNTGDWNTGFFNTITPSKILVFNKSCKFCEWNKAKKPQWIHVSLTRWIAEEDMTDKEKKAHPTYKTLSGYLKVYKTLREAYKDSWDKASKEDKELTFKLPNFDIEVFKEIFGFEPIIEEK